MTAPAVVVAGAGGVLGEALCREIVRDAPVIALRREGSPSVPVAGVRTLHLPLDDGKAVAEALHPYGAGDQSIGLLIHNAAALRIAPFDELDRADFEALWRASVGTALAAVKAVLPGMRARQRGCLLFCGATASVRGGARFAAFAAAKFALRGLAQSLARELQPEGIHVAHLVLDGLIAGSAAAQRFAGGGQAPHAAQLDPAAIASSCRQLAEQDRSAWSHELDLRPWQERF